jgi:hypothetical protein
MTLNTTRPFTRAEALQAGLTDVDLGTRRFQRLFHGLYIRSSVSVGVQEMAEAALHICPPGSYASHQTSGALWGVPLGEVTNVHVTVPGGYSRSERRGIVAHRADENVVPKRHSGLLLSAPTRVLLELAAERTNLVDLVAIGDALVRKKRTTLEELRAAAEAYEGRGARLARRAAAYVREGVDSPTESRLRMLIVLGRLGDPTPNVILRGEHGEWLRRLDICFPEHKVVVEYDGRDHVKIRQNWLKDIKRREELERQGWLFVIITSEALFGDPVDTWRRVRTALQSRGGAQLPRRLPAEWYRLFTGRAKAT